MAKLLTQVEAIALIIALAAIAVPPARCAAGRATHKRFVIHVPLRIKTHHHTHTVYSQVHSGGTKQTVYKILGYSTHGSDYGHGHGHGHGHGYVHEKIHGRGLGHGELMYDDVHGCDGHDTHGDMIFNHYARNDDVVYPEVDEYIDVDELGDEWE